MGGDASGCSLRVGVFGAGAVDPCDAGGNRASSGDFGAGYLWPVGGDGAGVAMECLETADGPTIWEDHFTLKW